MWSVSPSPTPVSSGNADAEQVVAGMDKKPGISYIGLTPNEIGCRRALITTIDDILPLVAASDLFNKLNLGRTKKETLNKTLPAIFEAVRRTNKGVRSYILTAFGCPYSGDVPAEAVVQMVLSLNYMGAKEVILVDSTGMATPKTVKELVKKIQAFQSGSNLAVHFHNTRGTAIANCIAAYELGIRTSIHLRGAASAERPMGPWSWASVIGTSQRKIWFTSSRRWAYHHRD
jgi:hydroxymethylglutaryl-CoA lyase